MSFLFSLLTGIPGFLNGILTYLNKRQDVALEQFRIGNTNGRDVSLAVVQAELARVNALSDVTKSAMSHRIWWVAWGLGVFPVLAYHACIYWSSTFPGLGWTILKVPAEEAAFGTMVAQWMFGISGASAIVSGIANAWSKRA
jgi:hypothetical protein